MTYFRGIIQKLHREKTACIRIKTEFSKYRNTERDVSQGCVISQYLFDLYREASLGELEVIVEYVSDSHKLNNIRDEDDTMLIEDTERKIH